MVGSQNINTMLLNALLAWGVLILVAKECRILQIATINQEEINRLK